MTDQLNDVVLKEKSQKEKPCPAVATLMLINSKWSPMLVHCLSYQPLLFGQIQRTLKPISKKVLTQELKKLEQTGLINRVENIDTVITVQYSLTKRGESLLPVLEKLFEWGLNNVDNDELNLMYLNAVETLEPNSKL